MLLPGHCFRGFCIYHYSTEKSSVTFGTRLTFITTQGYIKARSLDPYIHSARICIGIESFVY